MTLAHTSTLARVPTQDQIARSYGDSFWLKAAVRDAYSRDPVDALRDAEVLVVMLANRVADQQDDEAYGRAHPQPPRFFCQIPFPPDQANR